MKAQEGTLISGHKEIPSGSHVFLVVKLIASSKALGCLEEGGGQCGRSQDPLLCPHTFASPTLPIILKVRDTFHGDLAQVCQEKQIWARTSRI